MNSISPYTHRQKITFAILVNIIVPLAGLSTDIYLPSLPALSLHFHVTKAFVQLTVSTYVMAMGLSQLLAGPISDAYGRKKPMLFAVGAQLVAILGILSSPTIYWIMFFRFIQGLGAAFMIVPARAIITDVFEGEEIKKQFNYASISFAIAPIIAPFLGGYFQHYLGWQANFWFILSYALLVTALLVFVYQETIPQSKPFFVASVWRNYQTILSNRYFLLCALFVGLAWAYGGLFNVTGPFLIQIALKHSAIVYGKVALFVGFSWFLGNTLSRLLFRYDIKIKTQFALWLSVFTAAAMLIFAKMGYFNLVTLVIPTSILVMMGGFVFPIYIGECLVIFKELAGSANACLFAIIWLIFGSFTIIATLLKAYSLVPISVAFICVTIFSLLFYYALVFNAKPLNQ